MKPCLTTSIRTRAMTDKSSVKRPLMLLALMKIFLSAV